VLKLEDLTVGASVRGLSPAGPVRILLVEWYGDVGVKISYELAPGRVEQEVLYRDAEARLELEQPGRAWSFDGDGQSLRLASEAKRIKLAHLFDPYLAVHTSRIEPLPHQITAVYGEMLDRQPLRFLLADDPGAGKTIMAGLLIKELMIRGDLERCLIVAPGSLVEQWQDELSEKFGLGFDILTRDLVDASRTGNPFAERPCWIARMDMLSRAEDLQALLTAAPEFDLVVCDEAHRMSASRFGDEVKYTQRHQLGQLLGGRCRHFLLMSATPHNGKDDDFQLFMSLLDGDRFEGRIYDVLGRLFDGEALRDLLVQAVRYGDDPGVRARLSQAVDGAVDRERLLDLLAERALVHNTLSQERVAEIRQEMERAAARRLQPHFIRDFFLDAFQRLGGRISRREAGRWEITHVPAAIRRRDRQIGRGEPVLDRYERVCFDKADIAGPPIAKFICPGHPLLDAVIDLIEEQYGTALKQGAVLVDERDTGREPRALAYLQHAVRDARARPGGRPNIISERLQFVELGPAGGARDAGPAPYLDYRPLKPEEREAVAAALEVPWLAEGLPALAERFAITRLVPEHLAEIRRRRLPEIEKEESEVEARLRREILHWDHRAQDLRLRERAGKETRLSAQVAEARANELQARLRRRQEELALARSISALPPTILGGALIVPSGLLRPAEEARPNGFGEASADVERLAMEAVMAAERALGCTPRDVSAAKVGYDIESLDPRTGRLRFIEVKGRAVGAEVVIVTRNEILTALNAADAFILAVVSVVDGFAHQPVYIRRPFIKEPDPQATAVVYHLRELMVRAEAPA